MIKEKLNFEHPEFFYQQIAGDEQLLDKKIVDIKERKYMGGINTNYQIIFIDGSSAIFKPKPEKDKLDLHRITKKETYFKRERAAYLVDHFLGFDLIPLTIIRKINSKIGSLQKFIPKAVPLFDSDYQRYLPTSNMRFYKLWILDYLVWNGDRKRKGNNLLVDPSLEIYAIDNSLTFTRDIFSPYAEFKGSGYSVPAEDKEKINQLAQSMDKRNKLARLLKELLSNQEIKALFYRLDHLAEIFNDRNFLNKEDLFYDKECKEEDLRRPDTYGWFPFP